MKRLFWIDGRLAWPFFFAILLFSISAIGIDFAWRVLVVPFELLLLGSIFVELVLVGLLIVSSALLKKRRQSL